MNKFNKRRMRWIQEHFHKAIKKANHYAIKVAEKDLYFARKLPTERNGYLAILLIERKDRLNRHRWFNELPIKTQCRLLKESDWINTNDLSKVLFLDLDNIKRRFKSKEKVCVK